jgi:hypothetical protein
MHASALALDVLELETNLLAGDSPDTERPDSARQPGRAHGQEWTMQTRCVDMDLKDLANLSERLNASTDQLNTELKAIEDRINTLSLGVEAWVTKYPLQEEFSNEWAALARNALVASAALGLSTRARTASELG